MSTTIGDEVGRLPFRREGLFRVRVGAALLAESDAFPLPFPDEGAFELREGPLVKGAYAHVPIR